MSVKRVFISQPMRGMTDDEILKARNKAVSFLEEQGYEVADSFFQETPTFSDEPDGCNHPMFCLAKSLEVLSTCDILYCCKGWNENRGCIIEHDAAIAYGLSVLECEE